MPELRLDPVTDKWVIIAPNRAKRPGDFAVKEKVNISPDDKKNCFFCSGNEKMTPPEVLAYSKDPCRKSNMPGWTVRAFANKFPAFEPKKDFNIQKNGLYFHASSVGHHEVIASVDHDKIPALFSKDEMAEFIRANKERFAVHCGDDFVKYVLIIYNHGKLAGGSIRHPHSQLFSMPVISNDIKDELDGAFKYFERNKRCVFCDMIDYEKKAEGGKRVIFKNENFVAFAPYASKAPFEIMILPTKHSPRFQDISSKEMQDLAEALLKVLKALHIKLDNPPFNFYIQSSPCDGNDYSSYYHWQLELLPKLSIRAGFEYGTGIIINTMDPDEAAKFLKN